MLWEKWVSKGMPSPWTGGPSTLQYAWQGATVLERKKGKATSPDLTSSDGRLVNRGVASVNSLSLFGCGVGTKLYRPCVFFNICLFILGFFNQSYLRFLVPILPADCCGALAWWLSSPRSWAYRDKHAQFTPKMMFLTELFRGTRSHYATNVCQGQTRITISRGACRVCRGAAKNQPFTTYVVYIVRTLCNISARFLLNQPESQCFIAVHYAFAAVSVFF